MLDDPGAEPAPPHTPGLFHLAHNTVDRIGRLLVNGVQQPGGRYGSPTSAAPNKVAWLTGAGRLLGGRGTLIDGCWEWAATPPPPPSSPPPIPSPL